MKANTPSATAIRTPGPKRRRRPPRRAGARRSADAPHLTIPAAALIDGPFETVDPLLSPIPFEHLGLDERLIRGVADRGFAGTTPIQGAVIPLVLAGRDLVACAETGTGKTAAFLLPLMHRLLHPQGPPPPGAPERRTQILILAPTRELAVQIEDDLSGFAYYTGLSSIAVYGGVGMDAQERALKAGVEIVVATPGRLLDHLRSNTADFAWVEVLVLDEADRMMDMGFWPDVRRIVSILPSPAGIRAASGEGVADAPGAIRARQTLLFSATMPDEVLRLALEIVDDPRYLQVGRRGEPARRVTHDVRMMPAGEKLGWLVSFLREADGTALVFARTKQGADRLARQLGSRGLRAAALHADRSQAERMAAVEGFRSGRHRVLVATDIAARGLDIDGIGYVINFEVPSSREAYVHRAGRTGRAEAKGTAITLAAPEEMRALGVLQRALGLKQSPDS